MQPAYTQRRLPAAGSRAVAQRCRTPPLSRLPARLQRRVVAAVPAPPSKEGGSSQVPAAGARPGRLQRLLAWSASRQAALPAVAKEAKPINADIQTAAPLAVAEVAAGDWEEEQVAAAAFILQQEERPQAAALQEEKAAPAKQAEAPSVPRPSGFSLYSWLTWGSGSAPTSTAEDESSSSSTAAQLAATADLADGMAAAEPPSMPAPSSSSSSISGSGSSSYWRRSWNNLSGRAPVEEGDAAAAASAARSRSGSSSGSRHRQQHISLDHPALELLRQRTLSGSQPGDRNDGFKLGLVVEGGGMRGCVSGGALQALADLGLRHCFDAVYGSSAGAINATYFLSGQRKGVEIYHEHIASPEFIDLKRLWKGRGSSSGSGSGSSSSGSSSASSGTGGGVGDSEPTPVLNLSFLVDHVMHNVLPLDWEAVIDSPIPLKVVASSLDTLNPMLLQDFADRQDLAECLKASATIPEIAGGPRLHRGQRLVDAAIFEPVPFRSAIADGCTHALVLCTRPVLLTRRSRVNTALADAMETAIKKAVMSPDYMVPAWKAEVDRLAADGLSEDDMLLQAATQAGTHTLPWFAGAHVLPLYPGAPANFSPLCIDPPTLREGVVEGRRNVLALCRALLGDCLDFSGYTELDSGSNNIVATRSPASSSARLWHRYLADADDPTHHAW